MYGTRREDWARRGILSADGERNIFVVLTEGIVLFYLVVAAARMLMG